MIENFAVKKQNLTAMTPKRSHIKVAPHLACAFKKSFEKCLAANFSTAAVMQLPGPTYQRQTRVSDVRIHEVTRSRNPTEGLRGRDTY